MTLISLAQSGQAPVGSVIGLELLGANFLFNRVSFNEGVGTGGFDETAASLGIEHVRYPGGTITERQFDPANPDSTVQTTDLITGAPLSNTNQHTLTPLSEFLAEAAEQDWRVTIVLPTARYLDFLGTPGGRAAVEAEIKTFVTDTLSGPNGHVIEGFEIGNEWYAIGLSASEYGTIADAMAPWVAQAIADANPAETPFIGLQVGQRANSFTETDAILAQMSSASLSVIDTAIVHNYRPQPWDQAGTTEGKLAQVARAEAAVGRPLDTLVSEWNVGNASPNDGLLQAAGILEMFYQLVEGGVDRAHIWPVLENNTTRLADNVIVEGEAADLMIGGEIFRQMAQSLPGTQALDINRRLDTDGNGTADYLLHAFGDTGTGTVVFLSSLLPSTAAISLDLSALDNRVPSDGHLWMTRISVAEGQNPISPNARPEVSAIALSQALDTIATTPLQLTLDPYEVIRLEFTGSDLGVLALADTAQADSLRLTDASEVFVMVRDGKLDLLRDFDPAFDRLDVSALGIASRDALRIDTLYRADGTASWLQITDVTGLAEVALRLVDGLSLDASRLDERVFIFAEEAGPPPPATQVTDTTARDNLKAQQEAEDFSLSNDGQHDLIRNFDLNLDRLDVSAWGATGLGDLGIELQFRKDGSANWLNIFDPMGENEVSLRFSSGQTLDTAALTADHFVFASAPLPAPAPTLVVDPDGYADLRGQDGAERFVLADDGAADLLRNFERGIDTLDVTAFDITSFSELSLVNQVRKNGTVSWIQLIDDEGEIELRLRLDGEASDAALLTESDFQF
ncbi:MAG: hypothetical protein AAF674_02045 [Pseudomonadota bacterium]